MPTTVVEVYRDLPGASAHHIWDKFAEDNRGLYIIGGSTYTGKSKFAEKTAVEAAKYLKVRASEFVVVDFDNRKSDSPHYLSYTNEPINSKSSTKQQANEEYVKKVVTEVVAKGVRIAVIDEIRSRLHAEIAVRLRQAGIIVFAVFRSYEKSSIFNRFTDAITNGDLSDTVEKPAYLAFLSLVYTQNADHIRREGFVEYYEGNIKIPTSMKEN